MKRSKLFEAMPLFLRESLLNLYARKLNKQRFGEFYSETLRFLRESQWWTLEEFEKYQLDRLKEVVREACLYVPFYRDRFRQADIEEISAEAGTPLEFLSAFPIIEKGMLRENIAAFTSTDPRLKTVGYATTSGTTGMPLRLPYDQFTPQLSQAFLRRFYDWMDLPDHFRSIRFSGNAIVPGGVSKPPFWLENKERSQLFMSTYHINESTIPYYLEKIRSYSPSLIDGYPSAIGFIAKFILENSFKLGFTPVAIATTAETLDDLTRIEIEEAFGCKVFNQYASSEGAPLITECKHGTLHLNPESGIFEFVNIKGSLAGPGEICEMIVTSFRNRKVPLIRYRIGDTVQLPEKNKVVCPCGRRMPSVKKVMGRADDLLYSTRGNAIGMVNYRLFEHANNIKRSQIVQKSSDRYLVRVVKDEKYSYFDEKGIIEKAKLAFGKDAIILFEYPDHIELSANGKYKASINEWKNK